MAVKIFLTGVTGYIAGDAFSVLQSKHPEYEYAVLVRSKEKGEVVKKAYPGTRIVIGDLDNSDVLKQEASKADFVLHAADASDHEGAAKAIAAGMVEGHSEDHPGFWLHTGGTGILTWEDAEKGRLGEHSDKEYNDWDGVEELTGLPDSAFHRNVDKIVLEAGTKHSKVLKTALVCPPTIYGRGRGPVAVRSRQAYELTKLILNEKYIPVIGAGKARWNHIHVSDLSQLFLLLVEAAAAYKLDAELWGARGYYLCESGEHVWTELAEKIAKDAEELGFVKKLEKKDLARQAALDVAGFEAVSWGLNSRGKAERARKLLGWKPKAKSIEEEAPNIVKDEHARLMGGS
ncbi:hypothetical protein LTR01_003120 [Friedmanniomyces endolithicus]|nr:hypothetical protein LTR01_003120 [Friedmanniomyces endolithicus]KAK0832440.1 hypothetical protein LTR73_002727 [Friedmanniomyces endolithicus]